MRPSSKFKQLLFTLVALVALTGLASAADPGEPAQFNSSISDQKPGAILFYNLYSSSVTAPHIQDTRINITNTTSLLGFSVHLFFVDGATCGVADAYICLTANQTASFLASDLDPGTTGFLIAVATDSLGCPFGFNFLIGDAYVKLSTGHAANLAAEAVAAQFIIFFNCDPSSFTATLCFDELGFGDSYNPLPRVLAVDNIPSRADGNDTLLVVNRIGGNLATGAAPLQAVFGILYDDAENAASFTFSPNRCQLITSISSSFPRTVPRFDKLVPSGRSGWMKIWAEAENVAILGSMINFNPNAGTEANAFNGGHNLHKLRLNGFGSGTFASPSLTIPIFPPSC